MQHGEIDAQNGERRPQASFCHLPYWRDLTQRKLGQIRMCQARISASAVSSMRLLKPHSLSYQAQTLTSVPPMTLVNVAS